MGRGDEEVLVGVANDRVTSGPTTCFSDGRPHPQQTRHAFLFLLIINHQIIMGNKVSTCIRLAFMIF